MIWSIVAVACMIIAWLFAARPVALFLDRFVTVRMKSLAVSPLEYDISNLRVGDVSMPLLGTDNQRFDLTVQSDSQNRLVLSHRGQSFTLGPRLTRPDPAGRPDIKFTSEPGDELTFRIERIALIEPTPFEISFLGGRTPWWRQYLYYHLEWRKRSGAKLDMLWRFEQQYYSKTGWTEGQMMYDHFTGLIRAKISP